MTPTPSPRTAACPHDGLAMPHTLTFTAPGHADESHTWPIEAAPAGGLREARPEPMCGPEPPFDPEGCAHDHHGWLVCGELVGSSGGPMPDPVYCEHIDRRYAQWLERAALAASPSAAPLDDWPQRLDGHAPRWLQDRDDPTGMWTCGCGKTFAPDDFEGYHKHLRAAYSEEGAG